MKTVTELLQLVSLPLLLTLGAFQLGLLLQRKLKSPLCNPILISVLLILGFLSLTGMTVADYQAGIGSISWLLTPATICLAIPMYEHAQVLRRNLPAIAVGVCAGAVSCLAMVGIFSVLCGFDPELTVSLLPKSVTTAIGVPLSTLSGGVDAITTVAIMCTGIFASILGPTLCKLFRLTHPVAQGAAFGTAGHVIGTSKATELSPLAGAVSSLSLVVAGLLTAVLFPLAVSFL